MTAPTTGQGDHGELLERALAALDEMELELTEARRQVHEPIAVVGMGVRFPGSVETPEALWELLVDGRDAVTEVPRHRWDIDAVYDPDPDAPGKTYSRWGAFIDDVDRFDPAFFGISPREATSMDPQQRLLLEVSWRALEHAGIAPRRLAGEAVGVFLGMTANEYADLALQGGILADADAYFASGVAASVAAGRLAYALDLHGPAVSIDTACSSSLLATHLACQSLRARECDAALAGGVNLILGPSGHILTSRARMASFEGHCRTFDAGADGYVRGEGCAIVVLKRLADAVADGDRVLAVIRGTSTNQDGRSNGLTAPNASAQESVIRAALADAGVEPGEVQFVECHGTGTTLGDPIEVRALQAVYGRGRVGDSKLRVQSIKTNIGHLEAAAGIASLCKLVLALGEGVLPRHLHLDEPNPYIPWSDIGVAPAIGPEPWPGAGDAARLGAVSSFGFSGTNVHMVVEAPTAPTSPGTDARPARIYPVSARTPVALAELADAHARSLVALEPTSWNDAAATATTGRNHLVERLAVVAGSAQEASNLLAASVSGAASPDVVRGSAGAGDDGIVLLFTGQGSQRPGMGRQLYETEPTFRRVLDEIAALLRDHAGLDLLDVMFDVGSRPPGTSLDDTLLTQPALFAFEVAMAELWRTWGVEPAAVLGHSIGELAAAHVAGAVSLEDAIVVVEARGRLMQALPRDGAMVSVAADAATVEEIVGPFGADLAIAARNGPRRMVLSGRREAVEAGTERLVAKGLAVTALKVSHAFHSPLMDPMLDEFEAVVGSVAWRDPGIELISNRTGEVAEPGLLTTTAYWREQVREAVRFDDCLGHALALGHRTFVEVGPVPTLSSLATDRELPPGVSFVAASRSTDGEARELHRAVARLHTAGVELDWDAYEEPWGHGRANLPLYPFARDRYWHPRATPEAPSHTDARSAVLSLTGRPVRSPQLTGHAFEHELQADDSSGATPLSGMVLAEMVRLAATSAWPEGQVQVTDLRVDQPIVLSSSPLSVQVVLDPAVQRADVYSFDGGAWRHHVGAGLAPAGVAEPRPWPTGGAPLDEVDDLGEVPGAVHVARGAGEAVATLDAPPQRERAAASTRVVLEACGRLLVLAAAGGAGTTLAPGQTLVPTSLTRWRVERELSGRLHVRARVRPASGDGEATTIGDIEVLDAAGLLVASAEGVRLEPVTSVAGGGDAAGEDWWYAPAWLPSDVVRASTADARPLVVATPPGGGERSAGLLAHHDGTELVWKAGSLSADAAAVLTDLPGACVLVDLTAPDLEMEPALLADLAQLTQLAADHPAQPSLAFVTAGAMAAIAGDAVPGYRWAAAWGLGRAAMAEHRRLRLRLIDVAPRDAGIVEALLTELSADAQDHEPEVAWRAGRRFVRRLVRSKPGGDGSAVGELDASGAWVLSGGAGGLALEVAAELAAAGATRLVLWGRSPASAELTKTVDELAGQGVEVRYSSVDVTDEAGVDSAIVEALSGGMKLRGVVHAAGVTDDAMVGDLTAGRFESVLAPKMTGAENLLAAADRHDAEHVVLFAAGAGLLGAPGQGNYAAANAVLDSLAHARVAAGRRAISLDWGPWAGAGMAARVDGGLRRWDAQGVGALEPLEGRRAFRATLGADVPQLAVMKLRWSTLLHHYGKHGVPPLMRELARDAQRELRPAAVATTVDVRAELDASDADERQALVGGWVRAQVLQVVGLPADQVLEDRQLFTDLGLDSLMAVELSNRLAALFDLQLTSTVAFEEPTVAALSSHLLARLADEAPVPALATGAAEPGATDGSTRTTAVSSAQQRLLFLDQFTPGVSLHNLPIALRLSGQLDVAVLGRALTTIVTRHEAVRTTFALVDGGFEGRVQEPRAVPLPVVEIRPDELQAALEEEVAEPIDLAADLPIRVRLFALAADEHVLALTVHHVVADGWSVTRLGQELAELYTAGVEGRDAVLPELVIQYGDYAASEQARWDDPGADGGLAHWREVLSGSLPVLDLPTDRSRPAIRSYRGGTVRFELPATLMDSVDAFSREAGVTPFVTLLSAYAVALTRYARQDEVVIGTAAANRGRRDTADLIGLFINTIALRIAVDPEVSFTELVDDVRRRVITAFQHQDVPFDRIVDAVRPARDPGQSPIYQTMFVYQNLPVPELVLPGLEVEVVPVDTGSAAVDLSIQLIPGPQGAIGDATFNADVFDAASVEQLVEAWTSLISALVGDGSGAVGSASLVSAGQADRVAALSPGPVAPVVQARVEALVEAQVERSPEAVAVVSDGEAWSYAELWEYSNRLAGYLQSVGVRPGDLVAVAVGRSAAMVAVVLGVWKAGAGYVPLDPEFPAERLAFMIADAGSAVVVTSGAIADLDLSGLTVVDLNVDADAIAAAEPPTSVEGGEVAYVIYTSGSTGRPKGVEATHANVVNFLMSMAREPGLGPDDVVLGLTTLSFDPSVLELCLPLLVGARVVVASRAHSTDGRALAELIRASGATLVQATPTTYSMLFEGGWLGDPALTVLCGGEAMSGELATRLTKSCGRVWNVYGPTETTVWSTVHRVSNAPDATSVSVGRPIDNAVCRILDPNLQLVPVGVPAELCIGGAGVARGYRNRDDLTAERFIADPYQPGGRLYRTGDLARWRPDGTLEFLGRLDHQVKVRGHRIELGEIETALRAHPGVVEAVVVAHGRDASASLCAYCIPAEPDDPPATRELRAALAARLPAYMLPNAYVFLDHFPLTPTRKIDRNALPKPDVVVGRGETVAPRTETESVLAEIWGDVLGLAVVGVEDDFFELGGHSLLASRMVARVRSRLDLELGVRAIFEAPTVARLAALIEASGGREVARPPLVAADPSAPLRLSFAQERMWFLEQLVPDSAVYNMPFGVRVRGPLDAAAMVRALSALVDRHEVLRTRVVVDGDGVARPVVDAPGGAVIDAFAVEGDGDGSAVDRAVERLRAMTHEPVDLATGPVFRAALAELGPDDHALLVVTHHIAGDQWSLGLMGRDLAALYAAELSGQPAALPELSVQYKDFAAWQRDWMQGDVLDAQLEFWRQELAGLQPLALPTDRSHPPMETYRGATVTWTPPEHLLGDVEAFARRQGVSLFAVLLASFDVLLGRVCAQDDVAVGVPVSNRADVATEPIIGNFVNTLVLRADVSGDPSFVDLVHQVQDRLLRAQAHQDVPFETLVHELVTHRDMGRSPLVQVLFNIVQPVFRADTLSDLAVDLLTFDREVAQFDLSVLVMPGDVVTTDQVIVEFNAEVFDAASVEGLVEAWGVLLVGLVGDGSASVASVGLLSTEERGRVEGLSAGSAVPVERCRVEELVRGQVGTSPDAAAVVMGADQLSYAELWERSDRLAAFLQGVGVGVGDLVGVAVERSVAMVVALLGVWKAGAAYVPLDPGFPAERLAFMVADAGLGVVVTSGPVGNLDLSGLTVVDVVGGWEEITAAGEPAAVVGGDVAYVMYTSGSTGRPKGVEVTHANVVNFLGSMRREPGLGSDDVLVAVTTLSFDISVLELLLPLVVGARVVVASREQAGDGRLLAQLVEGSGATVMQATPTTWSMLFEAGWSGAAGLTVLCGGEAMSVELAAQLRATCGQVWNMFGPTETTVWSTVFEVSGGEVGSSVPIGRPIDNTVCRVVDRDLQLVPVGVPGELCIGGVGVARGYRNRVELTAERFIDDPYVPGGRLYRTGDLARWRADGTLEFRGRLDHQVKVRGHRIELGEIETALRAHPGVSDVVVVAHGHDANATLCAYCIPTNPGQPPTTAELRATLATQLPNYMIPNTYLLLDHFPQTPNRKIDRNALPKPGEADRAAITPYVEPRTAVEQVVARTFAEVLGVERVGVFETFFELGGSSLQVTSLLARLQATFGVEVSLRTFFTGPTVAGTAEALVVDELDRPRVERVAQLRADLDAMSPDEVARLLAAKRAARTAEAR